MPPLPPRHLLAPGLEAAFGNPFPSGPRKA